jgi:hypothetical protein
MVIVKVASKDARCNPQLDETLMRLAGQHKVRYSDQGFGIAQVRNRAVNRFLHEDAESHLLMIDADMVWLPETAAMIEDPRADIAYAKYADKMGGPAHEGQLGCACLRISRRAALAIRPPWFAFEHDDQGCADAACECSYFRAKAQAAGFTPAALCNIGHIVPVLAVPDGCRVKFQPLQVEI